MASPPPLDAPLALIAGRGDLPRRVAARCLAEGRPLHVIVIRDHGDPDAYAHLGVPVITLRLGQGGTALAWVRRHGVRDLVLAGAVSRPSLRALWPDAYTAGFVARVGMRALGDDSLLRAVMARMEAEGLRVHPVHSLLTDTVGQPGTLTAMPPDADAWRDIRRGLTVGRALGAVDVGQSVVVQQGVVLGVEALEGTDALLTRCGPLRLDGPGGVLVKLCKPGQDRRADLPTLGTTTVETAHRAGLRGIAYEAGATLVLAPEEVAARADALGLFVVGLEPSNTPDARNPTPPSPEGAARPHTGHAEDAAPLVYMITGEPSGDALAARLMVALRDHTGGRIRFAGIGGEAMAAQGLASRVNQRDLAIMGFLEVLPRVLALRRHLRATVRDILDTQPAAVVTVDSWGFTGRIAKALKARGSTIPRIHVVAPMVWAWKESRKHAVAARIDHLLTIWPFECAYFRPLGLECTYIGHPVIEAGADSGDGPGFRAAHGIPPESPLLVVLPGSRRTEVSRLLPVFRETVARLAATRPGLRVVVPTVATVADTVEAALPDWPVPATLVRGAVARHDAFAAANAALAASGTVSLELAMADVPHVIAYRANPVSATLFRLMTRLRYAGPVNLLMGREVVPERLQERCRPSLLVKAVAPLLDGGSAAASQRAALAETRQRLVAGGVPSEGLHTDGGAPSDRAATVILHQMRGADPSAPAV